MLSALPLSLPRCLGDKPQGRTALGTSRSLDTGGGTRWLNDRRDRAGRGDDDDRMQNAVSAPAIPRRADPYRDKTNLDSVSGRVASGNPALIPAVLDENGSAHSSITEAPRPTGSSARSSSRTTGSPPHHDGHTRPDSQSSPGCSPMSAIVRLLTLPSSAARASISCIPNSVVEHVGI